MSIKHLQLGIYLSAITVAVGVFLPITSLPLYGDVSYNRIASIQSYIVIAFALTAPALLFLNRSGQVLIVVAGIWLTLLFPTIKSQLPLGNQNFVSELATSAGSAMTDFAADLLLNVADFSWGGFVFLLGLIAITICSLLLVFKVR